MKALIDIGVNLTNKSLLRDLDGVLRRAAEAGVGQMVVIGSTLAESRESIALCARYPDRLLATAGVHPHHADEWGPGSGAELEALAAQRAVRAIGETGLDFNRNYSPPDAQERAFAAQLDLAADLGLPVYCHQRDAHRRFVDILDAHRARLARVVVHCFTDGRDALIDYLDRDCYIGVTGWICDERRGRELQQLVRLIPAERLLLETDAPYLLPRDLRPKPASRVNEPAYLPHILAAVAHHRGEAPERLAAACLANSQRFFSR